eukprot:TRINITY_DN57656_c0_g1_i1.p2 TRINITY_DN57656_c0_g1~~TRINITY_DN57656_c0_g1_i1.p2  ORF type:complete len:124 (+),score=59.48 TRINITY_DN57656_c0_g1_i1:183-554(+)
MCIRDRSNPLEGLKVAQLKELLSDMGLPTSGRKADLIARLEQAKGKDNHGEDSDEAPEEMSMEGAEKAAKETVEHERESKRKVKEEEKARRRRITAQPEKVSSAEEFPQELMAAALELSLIHI